mgnify:FL=1
METLGTVILTMLSYIRPVGESISTNQGKPIDAYPGYDTQFYGSGTMALQQALNLAKAKSGSAQAEVLLPAYACPDLISACVGADVKAVLMDNAAPNSPFPSIETIKQLTNENTAAVILVNFLGISPSSQLFNDIKELKLLIIEDRAQSFIPPEETSLLIGDYIVFSFGKGKPVSLLGGGALLIKDQNTPNSIGDHQEQANAKLPWLIRLYNLIIQPFFYYFLMKTPGLSIGETHYHVPEKITLMDNARLALLDSNIDKQYRSRQPFAQEQLYTICASPKNIQALSSELPQLLLRFPILCNNQLTRDQILSQLNQQGIGASKMYKTTLPNIEGTPLSEAQKQNPYPCAQSFADRLLTLPCHSDVGVSSLSKIADILSAHALPAETNKQEIH